MYLIRFILPSVLFLFVSGQTINDTETLMRDLFSKYNRRVRPLYNQSDTIMVNVSLFIKTIQEFDEIEGTFSFSGALYLQWKDYYMQWDPNMYGGLTSLTVFYGDVWVPQLSLSTPSSSAITVGKSTDIIRFDNDGHAGWLPVSLFKSTCLVNERYFPFDVQKCTTAFASLGYKHYEVTLNNSGYNFYVFAENPMWEVEDSEESSTIFDIGQGSEIYFTLLLRRRSGHVVLNLLVPILALCFLNTWVFMLKPDSRVGFGITSLLAIAVYMTIVSGNLPKSSKPIPLILYKLLLDFTLSVFIICVTLLNLRLGNRGSDTDVPFWLQRLYNNLSCVKLKGREVTRHHEKYVAYLKSSGNRRLPGIYEANSHNEPSEVMEKKQEIMGKDPEVMDKKFNQSYPAPVTWSMVCTMVDWIAFIGFLLAFFLSFFVFVVAARNSS